MKNSLRILCCLAGLTAGGILRAAVTEPPVPVRTVAPDYPAKMKASGTSGLVVVACDIDDKGSVSNVTVAKTTDDAFNDAAIAAVQKWKFRPGQKDGAPVATHVNLPVKFSVGD